MSTSRKTSVKVSNVHRRHAGKDQFSGMEVIFLGTSAGGPQAGRGASAVAMRLAGHSQVGSHLWLFDCGEGTYRQLLSSTLSHSRVERIFVSHLHGDHIWGLASMIVSALTESSDPEPTLHIYGPRGLHAYLCCTFDISRAGLKKTHRIIVSEFEDVKEMRTEEYQRRGRSIRDRWERVALHPQILRVDLKEQQGDEWLVYEDEWCWVKAARLNHVIPCFGYVVSEKIKKYKVDAQKATKLGVPPGKIYRVFQDGGDVTLENGTIIRASDVVFPPPPPRKVAVFSDTSAPSAALARLAKDSDLLVHEATVSDAEIDKAIARGHSTPKMAGAFAKKIHAKTLALTHFSARYLPVRRGMDKTKSFLDATNDKTIDLLVREAKRAFSSSNVLAAFDFMSIQIPQGSPPSISGNEEISSVVEEEEEVVSLDDVAAASFSSSSEGGSSESSSSRPRHPSPSSSTSSGEDIDDLHVGARQKEIL